MNLESLEKAWENIGEKALVANLEPQFFNFLINTALESLNEFSAPFSHKALLIKLGFDLGLEYARIEREKEELADRIVEKLSQGARSFTEEELAIIDKNFKDLM